MNAPERSISTRFSPNLLATVSGSNMASQAQRPAASTPFAQQAMSESMLTWGRPLLEQLDKLPGRKGQVHSLYEAINPGVEFPEFLGVVDGLERIGAIRIESRNKFGNHLIARA